MFLSDNVEISSGTRKNSFKKLFYHKNLNSLPVNSYSALFHLTSQTSI